MTILIIKSVWKRKWPHPRITASVGLVVVGCLVAGAGDLSFDGTAYLFAFGSVLVQALYLLLVEFQVRCSVVPSCFEGQAVHFSSRAAVRSHIVIVMACGYVSVQKPSGYLAGMLV